MASSVIDADNPQGVKESKDNNKDLAILVDERLIKITSFMATLTGRVANMEKHFEELESIRDFEELRGEVQAAVNSMVINVNGRPKLFEHIKPLKKRNSKLVRLR